MTYNTELADRVRHKLDELKAKKVTEREMFGGISFMVAGNMVCGVQKDDLIVRLEPTLHQDALTRPNAREMDFTGRPMKGFIAVGPAGTDDDNELDLWVRLGLTYAQSLPAKAPAKKKKAPAKKKAAAPKAKAKAAAKKAKPAAKKKAAAKKAPAKKKRAR